MEEPNPNAAVGQNIKLLRTELGLTQEAIAQYLNITRELVSMYETGARSVPSIHLSKLANLFCMNEYDFYETDPNIKKTNIAFAFRADHLEPMDLESIARFKKIVRNYINMKEVTSHE
jgi:transcriptional regulator with XRE-family HTH domain